MKRREFLGRGVALAAALSSWSRAKAGPAPARRMTIDLTASRIGIRGDLPEIIDLAHRHGFESVAPSAGYLGRLSEDELQKLLEDLKSKHLVWGGAGLPVSVTGDESRFERGLKALPKTAAVLQRAGVRRISTAVSPRHPTLTYVRNFRRHALRLRQVARVLADHDLAFGLEYIGPKTLWAASGHPFVHTMAEAKDLIAEIDVPNVGFVLDSWHWYTAHETVDDLRTLKASQIVAVDLNDAPAGIPIDEQVDSRRELPMATGVIDLAAFLGVLVELGYDGPVRAEPFNRKLNEMPNEEAAAATGKAMKKAFALVE